MYKDESKKFDIRVVDKYVQDGVITPGEYAEYINNLPDMSWNIDKNYELTFAPVHRRAAGRIRLRGSTEDGSSRHEYESRCSSGAEKSDD